MKAQRIYFRNETPYWLNLCLKPGTDSLVIVISDSPGDGLPIPTGATRSFEITDAVRACCRNGRLAYEISVRFSRRQRIVFDPNAQRLPDGPLFVLAAAP